MTNQTSLFSINDVVNINWESVAKEFGTRDVEEISTGFFEAEKGNQYAKDGAFIITKVFVGGVHENGEIWQTYVLKPLDSSLNATDFLSEKTILETVSNMEQAMTDGAVLMDNCNLKLTTLH